MRICLIPSSYHPYTGGVEEHVRNVARELTDMGHTVQVWTVDRGEHLGVQLVDGITVRYLPTPLPARSASALARFARQAPSAWHAWMAAHRAFRPDVMNVQCFGPNGIYAEDLNRVTKTPLIVSSHGETFMDDHHVFDSSRLLRSALRHAPTCASALTACSGVTAADLRERFGWPNTIVVPNGVDLGEPERCAESKPPFDPAVPTVVAVGRLEEVKGFDVLIRAMADPRVDPRLRLVIGGDGSAKASLEALISELGLEDRVALPGRLDRCGVVQAMQNAAMVVVPSRIEAFGIVVLEAWRSGRPLIATDQGGPRDLVRNGETGLLVPPGNPDALATAIRTLWEEPQRTETLARNGLDEVASFSWHGVAEQYLSLYADVLRARYPVSAARHTRPATL